MGRGGIQKTEFRSQNLKNNTGANSLESNVTGALTLVKVRAQCRAC
jgi:hypothetical protein